MAEPRLAVYVRALASARARISRTRPASGATRTAGRSRGSASACSIRGRTTRSRAEAPAASAAPAALRADDRRRGGRAGHVVRRRGAGPAADRRLQPRLRDAAAHGGPRDPRACRARMLRVSADAPLADWFARLNDVAPDGTVTLVAGAGQNGAHRESAREPKAIEPGEAFPLEIEMHFTSWVFPKGHRIRLAVNNAQWPMIWPTPYPMTTTLVLGGADGTRRPAPGRASRGTAPAELPADPAARSGASGLRGHSTTGTTSGYGEISSVDRNPRTGTRRRSRPRTPARTRYPWGEERTARVDHARGGGRQARGGLGPRRVRDRGQAARPDASVGERRHHSERPARTSTSSDRAACCRTECSCARRRGRTRFLATTSRCGGNPSRLSYPGSGRRGGFWR